MVRKKAKVVRHRRSFVSCERCKATKNKVSGCSTLRMSTNERNEANHPRSVTMEIPADSARYESSLATVRALQTCKSRLQVINSHRQ